VIRRVGRVDVGDVLHPIHELRYAGGWADVASSAGISSDLSARPRIPELRETQDGRAG